MGFALRSGEPGTLCVPMAAGQLRFVQAQVSEGTRIVLQVRDPQGVLLRSLPLQGQQAFALHAATDGPLVLRWHTAPAQEPTQEPARETAPAQAHARLQLRFPPSASPAPTAGDGGPAPATPQHAWLRQLQTALAQGQHSALPAFWQAVADAGGAPLLETLPDGQVRATLLWRSASPDAEARLLWPSPRLNTRPLQRLPGSDVHYLSVDLPAGSRVSYQLAAPLPALTGLPRPQLRQAVQAAARPDTLNPATWVTGEDATVHDTMSLLSLPGAPAQPWIVPNPAVPRGTLTRLDFHSERLDNVRKISLYTPSATSGEAPPSGYPLLVVFDETAYRDKVPAATVLDNLIAAGEIPPLVAVLVGNVDSDSRALELPCNAAFADMLAHELLPWLAKRYPLTHDQARRALAGSSFGGLAAACTALRHPGHFGLVLSQSGSFWWGPDASQPQWLVEAFSQHTPRTRLPLRFYLDAGLLEEASPDGILGSNRRLAEVLRSRGYPLTYREFAGGHDYAVWRETLADGLRVLFAAE